VRDRQGGITGIHRHRTGDEHLPREITGLLQHVIDARPVNGQEQHVGTFGGFARRAGRGAATRLTGEPVQLPLTARVTKDDIVPGFREDRAELSAHQTRIENSDTHVRALNLPRSAPMRLGPRHEVAPTEEVAVRSARRRCTFTLGHQLLQIDPVSMFPM
jgi:hypothetical protein